MTSELCRENAMRQWRASLKRKDLSDEDRVVGAIEAYERQKLALELRAVPDVPELVTVGYQYLIQRTGRWDNMPSDWSSEENKAYQDKNHVTRELVTKDQAAAVIAAKDAEIEGLAQGSDGRVSIAYSAGYYQAECNLPEHEREIDALADYRAMKAKLADYENQVPVAYLNSHPIGDKDYSHINKHDRLSAANKEAGWTETLLYAAPVVSNADLRAGNERLRHDANELRDLKASILRSKTLADFNTVKKTVIAISAHNPSEPRT